jgi:DNA-directed RNA polymerase specialized sigma24 family protein
MTEVIVNQESQVSLREFVKENESKVCHFLYFMLFGYSGLEEVTLRVFRGFGDYFQKQAVKKNSEWERMALRIELFSLAWRAILNAQHDVEYNWAYGRDTRPLKQLDEDLLSSDRALKLKKTELEPYLSRLSRVDIDFRAPMVLRDILGFDDEEILRILAIRWGVYRHRLHRGRLAFRESLKGKEGRESIN